MSEKVEIDRAHPFLMLRNPSILRDGQSFELLKLYHTDPTRSDATIEVRNRKMERSLQNLTNLSYKKLLNWEEEGLIIPFKEMENSWRRYSPMDAVWIGCIDKARSFGVSIPLLQKARESLQRVHEGFMTGSEYPALEFYVNRYELFGGKFFLLIIEDGTAIPLSLTELVGYIQEIDFYHTSYFLIDLSNIFLHVLPHFPHPFPEQHKSFVPLTMEQMVTLYHIDADKHVKEVKVKKGRNRKIAELEITKEFSADEFKAEQILHKSKDQELTTEQIRGYKTRHTQKTKLNFSKAEKALGSKSHPE